MALPLARRVPADTREFQRLWIFGGSYVLREVVGNRDLRLPGCLLGETTGLAYAECSIIGSSCATEWSDGSVINLGSLAGSNVSYALGINNSGQAVGYSVIDGLPAATEWSDSSVISLSGSTGSGANGINNAGQAVGYSNVGGTSVATEWSGGIGGSIINLGGLPGSTGSNAFSINDAGLAVGASFFGSVEIATEWSGGKVITWEACQAQ